MKTKEWVEKKLIGAAQMLLTTAPNTHGLSPFFMKAADGPEPHLLTPSAEFLPDG